MKKVVSFITAIPKLKESNKNVKFTVMKKAGHGEVVKAYLKYDIITWLTGGYGVLK